MQDYQCKLGQQSVGWVSLSSIAIKSNTTFNAIFNTSVRLKLVADIPIDV